jgi:hypothetical protein
MEVQLFSTFDSSIYLELAISKLEEQGIEKENIFAVPLDSRKKSVQLLEKIHRADSTSLIDIGMVLAVAFSVVGTSIGFQLAWGPIIWGLLSALLGFLVGIGIRLLIEMVHMKRKTPQKRNLEIILIIDCTAYQADKVESILWEHFANGVAKVGDSPPLL